MTASGCPVVEAQWQSTVSSTQELWIQFPVTAGLFILPHNNKILAKSHVHFFLLQNVLLSTHLHSWQEIFILNRNILKVLTNNTSIKKCEIWHACVRRREVTFQGIQY